MSIHNIRGSAIPPNKTLWNMEDQAYKSTPQNEIDGWTLLTPFSKGIKCYGRQRDIVVAIRGTADFRDIQADLQIVYSGITSSSRYKEDLSLLKAVQAKYPPEHFTYYGVAHSLGGAILDELIDAGYITEGVSYNPAVDLAKFRNNTKNHRIYNESDILYNIMGRFTSNPEVRKNKLSTWGKLASFVSLGKLGNSVKAHLLSNFVGGVLHYRLVLH